MTLGWKQSEDGIGHITGEDGRLLTSYRWGGAWHPYFHPLTHRGNPGCLTGEAPSDHRWHHGLWWSWKRINGVVFWEDSEPHANGRTLTRSCQGREEEDGTVGIDQRIEYLPPPTQGQEVWLHEERRIVARPRVPGADLPDGWALDWDLRFTAARRCVLDVFPPLMQERWGGYMGLNYRASRGMAWEEMLLNSEGRQGGEHDLKQYESCHGRPSRWAAYSGSLDGAGTVRPAQGGLAMLDHPSNPRHPCSWYCWTAGPQKSSFGFLSASPLMHEPMTLETGDQVGWRYRVVLFSGSAAAAAPALEQAWAAWRGGDR